MLMDTSRWVGVLDLNALDMFPGFSILLFFHMFLFLTAMM